MARARRPGNPLPPALCNLGCEEIYNFVVSRQEDSTYILEAIPIGKQVKDIECGTLTLDQNGSRWASGGGAKCWL